MPAETLADGSGGSSMSESVLSGSALNPLLDVVFGIGAIVVFAELILALRRAISTSFTAGRIIEIAVYCFLFVMCLDWVAGFNFFKDTVAPFIWNLSGSGKR